MHLVKWYTQSSWKNTLCVKPKESYISVSMNVSKLSIKN